MIACIFNDSGNKFNFRHVTTNSIIEKNGKILLVKRASDTYDEPNKYCLPGGYLDQNETIEQGVLREVREETGFESKIISLFRINGNPKRNEGNVDFVFLAKFLKKIGEHDNEVSEVKWFSLENLPNVKDVAFDHYENIELYLRYRKEKFSLPVLNIN